MQLERPTDRPVKDCKHPLLLGTPASRGFHFRVSLNSFIAKAISIICNVFTLCFVNSESTPRSNERFPTQGKCMAPFVLHIGRF